MKRNRDQALRVQRRRSIGLPAVRVVLQGSRTRRDQPHVIFGRWLAGSLRAILERLLGPYALNVMGILDALVVLGKDPYASGKRHSCFSETISAAMAGGPVSKRLDTARLDLAVDWIVDEPHKYNKVLPQAIFIAAVGLALPRGRNLEVAILAMDWAGGLRVGETLQARFEGLVLPRGASPGTWVALLLKTRGCAARHQYLRITSQDMVLLLDSVFALSLLTGLLWNRSPQVFVKRVGILRLHLAWSAERSATRNATRCRASDQEAPRTGHKPQKTLNVSEGEAYGFLRESLRCTTKKRHLQLIHRPCRRRLRAE